MVLITLDTTRADRLGAYGHEPARTPTLDRLAHEGALFEQTSTVAPLTVPAHCSVFTGLFPPRHGVRDNDGYRLAPQTVTLAEILRGRGFQTGAFLGSSVLNRRSGLNRGFDVYTDDFPVIAPARPRELRRPANEVTDVALTWLRHVSPDRFFAWLHFYDAHAPYEPPESFRSMNPDRYMGAISFADSQIGRVLDFLESRHLLDRTIVAVVGDHGESLGEHGERTHKLFVYESVLRVPLIIRAPFEAMRGRRIASVTRSVDLMPTLLDMLGFAVPPGIDGLSLVPVMTSTVNGLEADVYAEATYPLLHFGWSDLRAIRRGRFKLIVAPHPELYDLQDDPQERNNLYAERPELAQVLRTGLRSLEQGFARRSVHGLAVVMNQDARDRLASLGYIGGGTQVAEPDREPLADPKDKLDLYYRIVGERGPSVRESPTDPKSRKPNSNGPH